MTVSASQTGSISNTDLLLTSLFGSNLPSLFVPGNFYEIGDKVYLRNEDGKVVVYECIKDGIYNDVTLDGWKQFIVETNSGLRSDATKFTPGGYYYEGDIVFTTNPNGVIVIYQCDVEGRYETITSDGWVNISGNVNTDEDLMKNLVETVLKNIFGVGSTPSEFVPGKEYFVGDLDYVIDDNGAIHIRECLEDGIYQDTDNIGWGFYDTVSISGNGSLDYATDQEIIDMFLSNGGGIPGYGPGYDGDENGGDSSLFMWPDANEDGSPDTLWNEF